MVLADEPEVSAAIALECDRCLEGDTFSFTFEEPGTFRYACLFHPEMVGEVIVDPSVPPPGDLIF